MGGKISRGTLLTTLEMMKDDGKERIDSRIVNVQVGRKKIKRKLGAINFFGISIPWGDVSSAFYSTQIPNIEVYLSISKYIEFFTGLIPLLQKILRNQKLFVKISDFIKKNFNGPNEVERNKGSVVIFAEVENGKQKILEAYRFIEGYKMTALGASQITERINNGELKPGVYSPSLAFGSDFMNQFVIERII